MLSVTRGQVSEPGGNCTQVQQSAMTLEAENHENSSMDASKSGVEDAMAIDPKQGGTETSLPSTQLTLSEPSYLPLRPHSTPATLKWLAENYVKADNICIPRNVIYRHYCEFCHENRMSPVNPASFGKIIRQQFRKVKNRRLGTRGCSTYHYHGIGISVHSSHYEKLYGYTTPSFWSNLRTHKSSNGLKAQNLPKLFSSSQAMPSTSTSDVSPISFPPHVSMYQVFAHYDSWNDDFKKFFVLYQSHCYRLYQSIFTCNLDEIKEIFCHFWTNIPSHLAHVLNSNLIRNFIFLCDATLYRTLSTFLLPSTSKPISLSIIDPVKNFSECIHAYLAETKLPIPMPIQEEKINLASRLLRIVRRLISLNRIWPTAKVIVDDQKMVANMSQEWEKVDKTKIYCDILPTFQNAFKNERVAQTSLNSLISSWEKMIAKRLTFQAMIDWFEFIINSYILSAFGDFMNLKEGWSSVFLLAWSRISQLILYDLTISSAMSFGPYHLLSIISNDYLAHCVEMVELDSLIKNWEENLESEGKDKNLGREWTFPATADSTELNNLEFPIESRAQLVRPNSDDDEDSDQNPDLTLMQVFNEFSLNYFGSQNLTEEFKSLADAFSQTTTTDDDIIEENEEDLDLVLNSDEEKIIIETLMEVSCEDSYLGNPKKHDRLSKLNVEEAISNYPKIIRDMLLTAMHPTQVVWKDYFQF